MSKTTAASKSVSTLAAIWGRDDKEVSAARLATAEKRISVNAQKTILDLEESVSKAELVLGKVLERALVDHNFTEIVNADTAVAEAEEALALAVAAQEKFLG